MYEWMVEQGFAPIIIATKMDKIKRSALSKHIKIIADTLKVEPDTIMIPFSAESKQGRDDIWELIDSLVLPEGEEAEVVEEIPVEEVPVEETPATPEKQRKPRWKAEGKETAKKTKKLQDKKAAKNAKIAKSKKKK